MRAAYIASSTRPRRLARRDRNGDPAQRLSVRPRAMKLPAIEELMKLAREPRTVTPKWEAEDRV